MGEEVSLQALRIYGDILKHIVHLVKQQLTKTDKDLVVEKDIKWVLTVPDMQRDPAGVFMLKTAREVRTFFTRRFDPILGLQQW